MIWKETMKGIGGLDNQTHENLNLNGKHKRKYRLVPFRKRKTSFFVLKKANVESSTMSDLSGGIESQFKDRWKCAIDENSQKPYFFNRAKRVVTWSKPASFLEWKRFQDSNGNYYYYNQLTKETTWNKPKEYLEPEVKSTVTSITRVSSSSVLQNCDKGNSGRDIESEDTHKRDLPMINLEPSDTLTLDQDKEVLCNVKNDNHWQVLFNNSTGNPLFYNRKTKEMSIEKPEDFQEWITVQAASTNGTYFYNLLTGVSTWNHPSSDPEHKIAKNKSEEGRKILLRLISKCYRGKQFYVEKFLQRFGGRERVAIEAIRSFMEEGDSPFDERILAVSTYVKTAASSSGLEPYDENVDRWRGAPLVATKYTPDEMKHREVIKKHRTDKTKHTELVRTSKCSPLFDCSTSHVTTSASSRYLSKPVMLAGSSRRTVFLYK